VEKEQNMAGESIPQPKFQEITWYNQYELDASGMPLAEENQYGGGGPMSPDYSEAMKTFAAMGIRQPWKSESQVGVWGLVMVHPSERATYVDPFKKNRGEG
jgi:hypothetical protein